MASDGRESGSEAQRARPWPTIGRAWLRDCRVFQVARVDARSPKDGRTYPFYRIESSDWVNVVALTAERELVMVRQFRHGSGGFTLEIPGGMVDPGEDPKTAAARELREETGYQAGEVRALGSVNPNPALFGNTVHTFLASDCRRVGDRQNDGTEETEVVLLPEAELDDRLRSGDIDHALVVAGLFWWRLSR